MNNWLINLLGIIVCIAFIALGILWFLFFERILKWINRKNLSIFGGLSWIKFIGKGNSDEEILRDYYSSWYYRGFVVPLQTVARMMGIICALAGTYGLIRIIVYFVFKI
jgi:hypothetical protein